MLPPMINAMLALHDLDRLTAGYLVSELFAHGSLEPRAHALQTLRALDPTRRTSRVLREILKCSSL